jgi:hypothetical protein
MATISKGKVYNDPIRTCKENPSGYKGEAVACNYYPTPSNSRPADGSLEDSYDDKGPELWRHPVNPAAKPNTHTKPGSGSHRAGDKSD